jgi:hypothetical protein
MNTLNANVNAKFTDPLEKSGISVDPNMVRVDWKTGEEVPRGETTFICEIELTNQLYWIEEGSLPLQAIQPIRIRYYETPESNYLEVVGWELQIPLESSDDLPRLIPRRFLELFSKSQTQSLSESEDAAFAEICRQVDYRKFCANRRSSQYREARLVQKAPELRLELSDGSKKRLNPNLLKKLNVLNVGDYFSGHYKLNSEGEIQDVERIQFLEDPMNLPEDFWAT